MNEGRLVIRMSDKEKSELKNTANKFGLTLSDYMRRKLFYENEDLAGDEDRYVSPHTDKNNLLTVSILYKTFYLVREMLSKQDISPEEVMEIERKALEFTRGQREKYGYRVIKVEDE